MRRLLVSIALLLLVSATSGCGQPENRATGHLLIKPGRWNLNVSGRGETTLELMGRSSPTVSLVALNPTVPAAPLDRSRLGPRGAYVRTTDGSQLYLFVNEGDRAARIDYRAETETGAVTLTLSNEK